MLITLSKWNFRIRPVMRSNLRFRGSQYA